MSPLKFLNHLIFFGTLLGVYRTNFWTKKKITIFCILLQIVIEFLFHTLMTFGGFYLLIAKGANTQFDFIYSFFTGLAYFNFLAAVVAGIKYGHEFEYYLENIVQVYECCKNDKSFQKSLKKMHWFYILYLFFAIFFTIFRTVEILLQFASVDLFILVFVLLSQFMIRATIVLQHFTLFVIIMIVVSLVQCVNSSVLAVQLSVSRSVSLGQDDVTKEQIKEWVEKYLMLVNCCEKISQCFGQTFILSLGLTVTHYIFLAYYLCYITILKIDSTDFKKVSFVIFGYVTLLLLPIVAGQVLRNQAVKLHRISVRLYNNIIIGPTEAKAKSIKDFIRLQKKKPLVINFSPKLPAGLYMLPVILSFSLNNIIVLLQFNHVV